MKSTIVEPAIVEAITMEAAPMKPISVKSTKAAAVERPHLVKSAAVKTPAATAAMRPGIGEIWQTERGGAQQTSCECKRPPCPGPGSMFA